MKPRIVTPRCKELREQRAQRLRAMQWMQIEIAAAEEENRRYVEEVEMQRAALQKTSANAAH